MPATTDSGNNSKLIQNQLPSSTTSTTTNNTSTAAQQQQLTTQTEKPLHYQYLKEFRCEQCPLFLQHKCTQHKPFTCFYWHFCNQRRRRPIRKRDGTFNYSPDVYCTKYDETTGVCPDGDDCPYLHRTAGDTERRYHLRYYKTGICVYDTDTRGYCVKNGPHCAFAHGLHDLRNPVYDIRELQAMETGTPIQHLDPDGNGNNGQNNNNCIPNSLDKERNALNEDPRWQDTAYVLANYKTELCKRPPRLCRQGYACPQFHNNKDRRRSPKKYKYRSTPCPNVKQGDEWGDPSNCENSDGCPYCHTRTEQQFHPEIYKSTKCNDIQQTGYCPRGPFCAFAHIETSEEISAARELSMEGTTDLSALVSNVLPPNNCNTSPVPISRTNSMSASQQTNPLAHNRSNQQSVASSLPDHYPSSGFDLSAPQPPPQMHRDIPTPSGLGPIARPRSYSTSTANSSDNYLMSYLSEKTNGPSLKTNTCSLFSGTSSPLFANLRESAFGLQSSGADNSNSFFNPIDAVLNQTLDDLNLDDIHMEANSGQSGGQQNSVSNNNSDNHENNSINNSINSFGLHRNSSLLASTQPVNIPGNYSYILFNCYRIQQLFRLLVTDNCFHHRLSFRSIFLLNFLSIFYIC